jgi:hypothetical protein
LANLAGSYTAGQSISATAVSVARCWLKSAGHVPLDFARSSWACSPHAAILLHHGNAIRRPQALIAHIGEKQEEGSAGTAGCG